MSVTAKGRRWEILHSLWIGWTFTLGFFNWIAFLYIGLRARQRKWAFWGVFYLTPFMLAMANPNSDNWLGDLTVLLTVVLGVVGIIHAFSIRKEYLLCLEAMTRITSGKESAPKQRIETETASGKTVEERENDNFEDGGQAPQHRGPQRQIRSSEDVSVSPPIIAPRSRATVTNGTSERMPASPPKAPSISPITQSGDDLEYQMNV